MSTLIKSAAVEPSSHNKENKIFSWFSKRPILSVFLLLLLIEICAFGSVIGKMGIYLDEWSHFNKLHFNGSSWLNCLKCFCLDDRIIVRPIYAPCLATLYYIFHDRPLPYHLFNQACELAGAFFLYLALIEIIKDKTVSFMAAVLFLIFPSHDLTHYSIGAMSTTTAVTLYALSLWIFARGINYKTKGFIWLSAIIFLVSLLNYEICLPLFGVYMVTAAILLWKDYKPLQALLLAARSTIPSALAICMIIFYRKFFLPMLKVGWGYKLIFDPLNFVRVIYEGVRVSILPYAFSFYGMLTHDYFRDGAKAADMAALVAAVAILIYAISGLNKGESEIEPSHCTAGKLAVGLGGFLLVTAYFIFGLSPDYFPVLDSGINRINNASSIGAAMVIAGLIGWLSSYIKVQSTQMKSVVITALILPFVMLFMLANWQFARPWINSWSAQKQVINLIKSRAKAGLIHSGDTIILANLPRYTMWAPVFDGVWDFQSAIRISLNRSDIYGGVLSNRMVATPRSIDDRFENYLCYRYPFKQISVLIPNPITWIPIKSPQEFVDLAKKYNVSVRQEASEEALRFSDRIF